MHVSSRILGVLGSVIGLSAVTACGATTQTAPAFPTHSISMVVPVAPGSSPDITARRVATLAAKSLHQAFVVQNHTGGAGLIGIHDVASASPTGYTVGIGAVANFALAPHVTHGALTPSQVDPIAEVASVPVVLFVKASSPITSIRAWVAYARSHPGLTVAVDKENSLLDLNAALLARATGAQLRIVPVGTGKQALSVMNGSAQAGVLSPSVLVPYLKSHQIRILGVFARQPIAGLSAPTFWSQGIHVAAVPYQFVFAPPGTPQAVVTRLAQAFHQAVDSASFRSFARADLFSATYAGPTALRHQLTQDFSYYGRVLSEMHKSAAG